MFILTHPLKYSQIQVFTANVVKQMLLAPLKPMAVPSALSATYALYKGGLSATDNNNIYYAVQQTTVNATNKAADVTYNNFSVTIGSKTIKITLDKTSDMAAAANSGKICFVRLKEGTKSHYVLLDGMDSNATGFNRYLVADPDQGELRTLQDVFDRRDITANASNITEKYILG